MGPKFYASFSLASFWLLFCCCLFETADALLFSNSSSTTSTFLTANKPAQLLSPTTSSTYEPILIDTNPPPIPPAKTSTSSSRGGLLIDTNSPPPLPTTTRTQSSDGLDASIFTDPSLDPLSHTDVGYSALVSSCSYLRSSSYSAWVKTASYSEIVPLTTTPKPLGNTEWFPDTSSNGAVGSFSITRSPIYSYYTETVSNSPGYGRVFTFSDTGPCCGACYLFGGRVQVYFWPAAAATATATANVTATSISVPASLLVDHNNFTL